MRSGLVFIDRISLILLEKKFTALLHHLISAQDSTHATGRPSHTAAVHADHATIATPAAGSPGTRQYLRRPDGGGQVLLTGLDQSCVV